jgi:alpha-tubulin suppressor-like RCC1 family protein
VTDVRCNGINTNLGNTIILLSDGTIWSTGEGQNGVLGNAGTADIDEFEQEALGKTNWSSIHGGASCTNGSRMAIDATGAVYGWGYNISGLLGIGTSTLNNSTPTLVSTTPWTGTPSNIIGSGDANQGHMLIDDNGDAFYAGDNTYFQSADHHLGTKTGDIFVKIPVPMNKATWSDGFMSGSGVFVRMYMLDSNGVLYSWGYANSGGNDIGETNSGSHVHRPTPVPINSW